MEFVITTDLSVLPAAIECNADEVKAQLAEKLEYYNNLVVTESGIKEAKADKANLNKLRTAIDDRRKEVKKQCLAPYEAFETACKEILAMIDKPITAIDTQLKTFADAVVTEKRDALQAHFNSIASEKHAEWIDINRILNPKWKNSTMKLDALKREISEAVDRLLAEEAELQSIYGGTPLFTAIWGKYLETYDKGQTFAYAAVLIQQELQRQAAPPPMPEPMPEPMPIPEPPEADEPCITGTFRARGTRTQLQALSAFMKRNGIAFEVIRNKKEENNNGSNE